MPKTQERSRLTRNPDDCMGEIRATMQLENTDDRAVFEKGYAEEEEIRTDEIEGVVDTGARPGLALPEDVVERLGVRTQYETDVRYADDRSEKRPVVGPVNVTIAGRTAITTAVVLPTGSDALIGQIVLEDLDLRADCARGRLVVPPETPDRRVWRL